jgi:hypothetical protein
VETAGESFSFAAELRKDQYEMEAFHRFRKLSQELLEVNEKTCRASPVEIAYRPTKKPKRSAKKVQQPAGPPDFTSKSVIRSAKSATSSGSNTRRASHTSTTVFWERINPFAPLFVPSVEPAKIRLPSWSSAAV